MRVADVLSQSQIDALLNAALSGADDEKPAAQKSPEEKYRKYDFYSPRKFTKDRMKVLEAVFENYARVVSSRLNRLLHTTCVVELETIEQQRYHEFSNALSDGDILTVVDVDIPGEIRNDDLPVLLHCSTDLTLGMVDRLMGGVGALQDTGGDGYILTGIELKLYETLAKEMVSFLGGSWEAYVDVDFGFRRVENNPTLVELIGVDETVIIVSCGVELPSGMGQVSVCLPSMVLTNLFNAIERANQAGRGSGEDNSDEIMNILRESDLEITAELDRTTIKLWDLHFLNVGDVIDLNHPVDQPIYLRVGGRPWFSGKMGVQNSSKAVKISKTHHHHGKGEE